MTIEIKTSKETLAAEKLAARITELILSNFTDRQLKKGSFQITVNINAL